MQGLALVLLLATAVYAYPEGAPTKICDSMSPGGPHPNKGGKQTVASPYAISVNPPAFPKSVQPLMVTLISSDNKPFKGFMIRAYNDKGQSVGQFSPGSTNQHEMKQMHCSMAGDSMTQTNNTYKYSVQMYWMPQPDTTSVMFKATVVRDEYVYWEDITSALFMKEKETASSASCYAVYGFLLMVTSLVAVVGMK